jgi:hypothetical protein
MRGTLWVSPDMAPSGVCHELTHRFIEELGGEGYERAKWLDEGYATFVEATCGKRRFAPANPVPLAEMTTNAEWHALHEVDANRVYGSAYTAVRRLVARFGEKKLLAVFAALRDLELEPALVRVLGVDLAHAQAIVDAPDAPWVEPGVDPERARAIGTLHDRAWATFAELAGRRVAPPQLLIYRTRERFLDDLRAIGFSEDGLARFAHAGAPRPMFDKGGAVWVTPDMTPGAVCPEEARAFFEALAGDAYRRAKWLDEGFALLVTERVCHAPPPRPVPAPADRIPLADLATEAQFRAQWAANPKRVLDSAGSAVGRLAARFGGKKIVELIAALRGREVDAALREVLGLDLRGAEAAVSAPEGPSPSTP